MIFNGNEQQIQVCKLLLLNTKSFPCLNWHVARHLTKKIEISPQKCANLTQKNLWGLATLHLLPQTGIHCCTGYGWNYCWLESCLFIVFYFQSMFFASPLICSSMIHVYIYGKENIYTCIYLLSLPPFAVPVSLIWLQKQDAFKMTLCKVMCWKYQNDNNKMVI